MRETIGNLLLHLGWAIGGQGCDCGDNPFNRLADFMDKRVNREDLWDDLEPRTWWLKAICYVSEWLIRIGTRLTG